MSYHFADQNPDEEVLMVIKRHPWALVPWLARLLVLTVIWLGLVKNFGFSSISGWALLVFLTAALLDGANSLVSWSGSVFLLTTQRILIVDQKGLLHRILTEAPIERVQDITHEVKGGIATLLNFGSLKIQTASEQATMIFEKTPNPQAAQEAIVAALRRTRQSAL